MTAISQAAKKGNFCVSFREAGPYTIKALSHGAKAKGHDILEKTIKPSSLRSKYKDPEDYEAVYKRVTDLDLIGYVGHWDKSGIEGIYTGDIKKKPLAN